MEKWNPQLNAAPNYLLDRTEENILEWFYGINSVHNFLPAGLSGDLGSAPECRPGLRGLAMSRAEDLRAELLRAEHLKAEATWEENSDASRQAKINNTVVLA